MGFESANYHYVPGCAGVRELTDLLLRAWAKPLPRASGTFVYYVLRGPEHWIDIQVGAFSVAQGPSASIRVALPNPLPVLGALSKLFTLLLAEGEGYIIDKESKRTFTRINDSNWQIIESTYKARRALFQQYFGDFAAPISGEDVFAYVEKLRRNQNR
jgi:hypothetical protein